MKWLTLLAILSLTGCGGGSVQQSVVPTSAAMQVGQWEFVVTPNNGSAPLYIESNLSDNGPGLYSAQSQTMLYVSGGGYPQDEGGLFSACFNFEFNANPTGKSLAGILNSSNAVLLNASGTLTTADQVASGGTYTPTDPAVCGFQVGTGGTFSGYTVAPLNGTYSGTLSDGSTTSLQITQNADFTVNGTGTSTVPGTVTTLTLNPSDVIGAWFQAGGTATNPNGTSSLQISGHFDAAATHLLVAFYQFNGHTWVTGTLTKQ
jgi:hypothetical protein